MKHDWRRGPVIKFTGNNTRYVCVVCGRPCGAPYKPEIEEYDADRWWPHLEEMNAVMDDVDFNSDCLGPPIREEMI